ncbi:Peptidase S8, subtilisin-related [Trema orientale]|uniref:Peptidase S8, subtilisin-related n=1 Tax=Trema orientale TaxID=63057 RepID=A0A2P5D9B4_TREOI|nr:Peptidase S8, subtilisin-related [Trema orientale]
MSNDTKFECPKLSNDELISNVNYPSISIGKLKRHQGLDAKVIPKKIVFTKGLKRVPFEVSFDGKKAPSGYNFEHITWFNGWRSVRIVFTVNIEYFKYRSLLDNKLRQWSSPVQ